MKGARRLCERVDAGRPICHVAAEAGIARQTLGKWYRRWCELGVAGLVDRSSRPYRSPHQTDERVEDLVEWLRRGTKLGPVMLVAELAAFGVVMAAATVHRVLVRRGISRIADLDVTGQTMRVLPQRFEYRVPGQMVHLDVKKIGKIPDGGGHRVHGRGTDAHRASQRGPRPGYAYLHSAIDDCSRLAYTEELADEKGVTAAGFWDRAKEFFAAHGIDDIHRALTDNGSCYRSAVFNQNITPRSRPSTAGFRAPTAPPRRRGIEREPVLRIGSHTPDRNGDQGRTNSSPASASTTRPSPTEPANPSTSRSRTQRERFANLRISAN